MTGVRPTTIDCTACGAGLDVLGGGRVRRHICPYCSAELDAQHDYQVLRRYRDLRRPESPLKIGMSGRVFGVEVTVIGTIGMVEYYAGQVWAWVDHQVYSPTHGYAWLTWEDGRIVFTRKTRERPRPATYSPTQIEDAENRPVFRHDGKRYRYYGSGHARMTFVEGEFNFAPRIGTERRYVSALGKNGMFTVREGGGEIEYEISRLPDRAALLKSFGIDAGDLPKLSGVHPLETFRRSGLAIFTRNSALLAGIACIVLIFVLGDPQVIHRHEDHPIDRPYVGAFTITQPDRLVQIEMWADLANSWAFFEGEVTDGEDETVATFGREVGYYYGRDADGSWTEGSRDGHVNLKLPPGDYSLELVVEEAGVWRTGREPSRMSVSIREGVIAWWWLVLGAIGLIAVAMLFLLQRMIHSARRWSGSDWSDED
ncbi:MAG: DUF4178 domain-containing protein [Pseudomonadota bacterium]